MAMKMAFGDDLTSARRELIFVLEGSKPILSFTTRSD
jgi:hypothetical protein